MEFLRRATVALANTASDNELLDYAQMIAAASDAGIELCLVHVLPEGESLLARTPSVASHREALESLRSAAGSRPLTHGVVSCHVLTGPIVDRLLEFAAESRSDVIIVGHRRERKGRRSLGRRLAMKASCSVWMAPEGSRPVISGLVAAVDFSPPSAHALSFATLFASRLGIPECTAVYVYTPNALSPDDAVTRIIREEGEKAFDRFLAPLELNGVRIKPKIEASGSVASAVLRVAAAEHADLVVMGTRGLSSSSAVLLGSESEQMLIETDRPVLVTKHRGERLGVLEALLDRDLQPKEEPRFS